MNSENCKGIRSPAELPAPYIKQKQHLQRRKQTHHLPSPKSSPIPTPLLIAHKPVPQTKLQTLEAVVNDLETSIEKHRIRVDTQIFASLLETCFQLNSIDHGIRIHRLIPNNRLRRNVGLSSKLIRLYASNGRIEEAHQLFDEMSKRDPYAFPWNLLISGYTELGLYQDALALYFQMEEVGVEPDEFTFPR